MDIVDSSLLRNVVLTGHRGSGKTTLSEAMLVSAGVIGRAGRVETGTTVSDYDEFEHTLTHSVSLSVMSMDWRGHRINVLDAPGHPDFIGEVVSGLAGAEAAIILVNAVAGIQAATEMAWERAVEAGTQARAFVVTHLDGEGPSFERVVEDLHARFGPGVAAAALPGDSEILDIVRSQPSTDDVTLLETRNALIEIAADASDDLMARYLDGETIEADLLATGVTAAVAAGVLLPVLPAYGPNGSVAHLLDFIVEHIPSPAAAASPDGAFVARIIKTIVDPFAGLVSVVKVISGSIKAGTQVTDLRTGTHERAPHLFLLRGREQLEIPQLGPGDIGAIPKLGHVLAGDTLTSGGGVPLPDLPFPVPMYRSALVPHAAEDLDRLSAALQKLREQDRTFRVERDPDTAETILATVGPTQADLTLGRVRKQYGLAVDLAAPRVPYRETISGRAEHEYRHKKQTGGRGQFGHVILRVEPGTPGTGFAFTDQVVGGSVPRQFIPAVQAGVVETLASGPLAGAQVVDVNVTLLGGSYHPVDSNEVSFKTAAGHAVKEALLEANPELLEPVMHVVIRVPNDHLGDAMGDLTMRRGIVRSVETTGVGSVIDALVPLAEVQRYAPELNALSGGRGSALMDFDHYAIVPPLVRDRLLAAHAVRA